MKVLMVTPSFHPVVGGTEIAVQNLAQNLNHKGVKTDILTYNMDYRWSPKNNFEVVEIFGLKVIKVPAINIFSKFPINPIGKFFSLNVLPMMKLKPLMESYDIIHFHDDIDLSLPFFSSIQKPKVFHYHTLTATYRNYLRNPFMLNFIKKNFDLHISNSIATREILIGKFGFHENMVKLLYNGVTESMFCPDLATKEDNLLLYVGRINERKGIQILLESLLNIRNPVKLVIIGPVYDKGYFKKVLKLIDIIHSENKHSVKYLGELNQNDIIKWYQKATISITPSLNEPFGIVILEALACGTPVVASKVGGIPEIVKNGVNGVLVPPKDPEKLAKSIIYLLENNDLRTKMGENGRKTVVKNFAWSRITDKLLEFYSMLIT